VVKAPVHNNSQFMHRYFTSARLSIGGFFSNAFSREITAL